MDKPFKTKTEAVYDFIKMNILKGKFKPEQKITTREISQRIDVSDIPVREAIKQLEAEGLLKFIPHVGARVVKLNEREIEEIAMIRGELEGLAGRLSVGYLGEKDFKNLEKIQLDGELAVRSGQFAKLSELNKRFHFTIYNSIPHEMLRKMVTDLWNKSLMLPNLFVLSAARCRQSQKEHRQIIDALRGGDGKRAEKLIIKQKIDALRHLLKYIKKNPGNADGEKRKVA